MKVLQVTEGSEFTFLDLPIPTPGPGQAVFRVEAVTTCPQWDLHLRHNEPMFVGHRFAYPYTPGQPGHEATGFVHAVGPGVTDLQVGDRVSAWRDAGQHRNGCYAHYMLHEAANLIRVPFELPFAATAPVELAMCVSATFMVLAKMDVVRGARVGISGLGPAGLIAAQLARAEGAGEVVGFDLSAARREFAAGWCLDAAFDPREVGDRFPARPASPTLETIVDCVGAKASVEWGMDHTSDVMALFGVQREDYTFAVRHYRGLRLLGYPGHSREAAEYAVRRIGEGELNLEPLSTHHLPLERYGEGIDLLERQEAIKICFHPWWGPNGEGETG